MAKFKLSVDKAQLKRIISRKQKMLMNNIATVLKTKAIPHLIDLVMIGYDNLSDKANTGPDDPTNPALWRTEFKAKLEEDLNNTFVVNRNTITIKLGNKDFLGYTDGEVVDPDDDQPLHWLVFYIEGLLGDWAFISPEDFERLTGSPYSPEWGRFADGFMVSAEEYKDKGWDRTIPFSQVRHPFSGFSPLDIFKVALDEFKLRPFIKTAIQATARGKKL